MALYKNIYKIEELEYEQALVGVDDKNIKAIEEKFKVELRVLDGEIAINTDLLTSDPNATLTERRIKYIFKAMMMLLENKILLSEADFYSLISNIDEDNYQSIVSLYTEKDVLFTTISGKAIYPKTLNQKIYLKALETNDIVFALGPAGTGKTYLGVMFALKYLKTFKARRIVLVRPIVEAGEKLGFLPGDLKEKIDPYLLPIYDALYEAIGKETVTKLIEKGTIEVAPLAYMRGRTLDNAIVILDEAQNATLTQMKMFLTRLGFNSKMIVTGDITQIDLPNPHYSGLIEATSLLDDVKGIKIIKFERSDVMRHPLVFKIIERYENR